MLRVVSDHQSPLIVAPDSIDFGMEVIISGFAFVRTKVLIEVADNLTMRQQQYEVAATLGAASWVCDLTSEGCVLTSGHVLTP